ncbi:hypothetical protein PVK06_030546 [Gossypium arboreum]|uniref:Uncharacterized protein n=1 Tax=Gossypium arboreum TaxID=29729 RepID=A0ABR0NQY2_GOSAR|nr:hypothetical protein PVK06_030546 [Gossypium arboreum]
MEIASEQADQDILEATMKNMDEKHKLVMANLVKNHEEALEKYKVDLDALNNLTSAQLDFNVYFWGCLEKFLEEWKNSSKLYFTKNPTEVSVSPTTGHEGEHEGEDEELGDRHNTSVTHDFIVFIIIVFLYFEMENLCLF